MHFLFSIFDFIDNNCYIAGQGTMKQKRYDLGITRGLGSLQAKRRMFWNMPHYSKNILVSS